MWFICFYASHFVATVAADYQATVTVLLGYASPVSLTPAGLVGLITPSDDAVVVGLYKESLRAGGVPPDDIALSVTQREAEAVVPDSQFSVSFTLSMAPIVALEARKVAYDILSGSSSFEMFLCFCSWGPCGSVAAAVGT